MKEDPVIRDLILSHPLFRNCKECGNNTMIHGSTAIQTSKYKYRIIFGSNADFCTKCGATWK
jgi:hypothetical protein